jgi:hypothetical protein
MYKVEKSIAITRRLKVWRRLLVVIRPKRYGANAHQLAGLVPPVHHIVGRFGHRSLQTAQVSTEPSPSA